MTKRNFYKVTGQWGGIRHIGSFYVQVADLTDTRSGRVYVDGAARVVSAANGMKPVSRGKGGSIPFRGENAVSDAARLALDLAHAETLAAR